ncbi:hypothetical protein P245_20860 [Comamonas thiooxydans]|uniref:Uncharacterized protein n=1 Tax=Comamonas thiooxydans TaxID=363952 RepID=A0A0E3BXM0_9BURK|nr:hypothetical protein [Comamonas thiooxydans]KGG86171.1 hypothetical protein P245_20860 [Comamonas thiooxydans]
MTRDEWINKYVESMIAGGSYYNELELRSIAETNCDATERTGLTDPDEWEDPSVIAEEHLQSE